MHNFICPVGIFAGDIVEVKEQDDCARNEKHNIAEVVPKFGYWALNHREYKEASELVYLEAVGQTCSQVDGEMTRLKHYSRKIREADRSSCLWNDSIENQQ
jgi:hypothetical protein